MPREQILFERKKLLLKKALDRNLQKKHLVESIIRKQEEELKETEVLLEKVHATPVYLNRS